MIKVVLVEDQRLLRAGLKSLIEVEEDMTVIGQATNGQEALEMVQEIHPDVVLMDIHMPELDGLQAAAKIKQHHPDVRVVFLTTYAEEDLVIRGINIGADGFLLKDLYPENVHQAIRDAYRGQTVLSGEVAQVLVNKIRQLTQNPKQTLAIRLENRGIHLTKRELEIAHLFMKGKSNKQIAQHCQLTEGTIKNYISELYMKLDIHNRSEARQYLKDQLNSQ